jgi:hypothetical protein
MAVRLGDLGRLGWGLAVLLAWPVAGRCAEPDAQVIPVARPAVSLVQQHCGSCHGGDEPDADLRLDDLTHLSAETASRWMAVHARVFNGSMPPPDAEQPTHADRQAILQAIETAALEARRGQQQGGVRRLNRRELSAALQDLVGLEMDYTAALPGDGRVAGFDTGADGLQDASASVAQIMEVTRRAVDAIRFLEPAPGPVFTADLSTSKDPRKEFDSWKNAGALPKPQGQARPFVGLVMEPKWLGDRGGSEFYLPPPPHGHGVLRLRVVVSVEKNYPEIPNPLLWIEVGNQAVGFHEITAKPGEPQTIVHTVQVDDLPIESRGVNVRLTPRVEMPYAVPGFENEDRTKPEDNVSGGGGLWRPMFDRKTLPPEKWPVPVVLLHHVTIEPNFVAAWPPESWGESVSISDSQQSAEKLLKLWIEHAWRRPVVAQDVQRFLELYNELRQQGLGFDAALRATFQSVLMSGSFRYLGSTADVDEASAQYTIASRLSFLITGGPPDVELKRLAAEGRLREAEVLAKQVERLLEDPRSDGFVHPFVMQWLEMDQPITIAMTHLNQADFRFARNLKASMQEETLEYVGALFRENRPAAELVASDWTMMNDILAHHYGYSGIEGHELRRVALRADDPRGGGLLSHAGIQSMLCWMGENWVIYRGAWTLRHVFDMPPPPAPLEVPELIPSDGSNRGKTFRELLVQHQQDARCSICHRTMDPVGFAFQNFDLSGRWRTVEHERYARGELDGKIEWRGEGETRPVDASGELPRGERFESFAEFRQLVGKHYAGDVARGLTKSLFVYAVGRQPDLADMAEIRVILAKHADTEYRLRDLLTAVVQSDAFLQPRTAGKREPESRATSIAN